MNKKHSNDIWREIEKANADNSKIMRENFVNDVISRREGISADGEKFIKGLHTFNPKVMPANKHDND